MTYDIEFDKVTKHYNKHLAVNDISLKVQKGTIFGLLGSNGAGKTTLMRMIVNLLAPDSGEVIVFGETPSPNIQRQIGYLPEGRGLYKLMTVGEQLTFFAKLKGLGRREANRRIDTWLERLSMAHCKHKIPIELSRGMHQRIQLIAAMVHDPRLLILDEPFTGLDPAAVSTLKEIILDMKRERKTIVFSTHNMEQVEQLCDNICLIHQASKVIDGPLSEVKMRYGYDTVILDAVASNNLDGIDSLLGDELITKATRYPNYYALQLKNGTDSQEILRRVMDAKVRVNRFELQKPSMNDIFVSLLQDQK